MLYAFIIHLSSYWLSVILLYRYDKNHIIKSPENIIKYKNAIKISLINQFGLTLPLLYLLRNNLEKSFICSTIYYNIFINTLLILFSSGLLFYIFHYILHLPYFYKRIHKMHHEFIIPMAPSSLYAHPIEHILCNNLSFLIPFMIFGTTYNIAMFLIIFASIMVTTSHVDYNFPIFGYSHVIHHKKFNCNYGFGNIFDKIFSSYREY
jgi:sterol desaturase/sphingolipid hydroxylase (fatty acid hydroxylase superfamily)